MKKLFRSPVAIAIAALVLVASGITAWQVMSAANGTTVTAEFVRAVGVNAGSEVRILGVSVGEITEVKPAGDVVRVTMDIDSGYDIPDEAKAVVIPPSVVADRYIEFTPAYQGGETLESGTVLETDRTVVPLELDEVYESLNDFSDALGENGSLADAVETAKENLEGNGEDLGESLDKIAEVSDVLNSHSDDLWSTVDNLAEFTEALAQSDAQVELFNEQLAEVSTQLADERGNLGQALEELSVALADVRVFVENNADKLTESVDKLTDLSSVLASQQEAIINILDYAPVALGNLDLAYNSASGTLDTRDDLLGPHDPASFLCSQLATAVPIEQIPQACFDLANALHANDAEMTDELSGLVGEGSQSPGEAE